MSQTQAASLTYPNNGYLGFPEHLVGQLSFLEGLRRLKKHNLSNVWLKCLKFQQKIVIYETVSLVSINQWSGVQAQSKLQLGLQNQEKQLSFLFFSARSQIAHPRQALAP